MSIISIQELKKIRSHENGEPLVDLEENHSTILCEYRRTDSHFRKLFVRQTVGEKLKRVQERLSSYHSSMQLLVTEGYRHPFYQEQYYLHHLLSLSRDNLSLSDDELQELTHQFVALPSVAGHPTGGAVDVTIAHEGKEIDMGGMIADFSDPAKLHTYSSSITPVQAENRRLLHDLMIMEGFAPFYGEWWHFSYGDREWAAFYNCSQTLYSPIFLS